jgi:hypothetical protein
MIRIFYLLIFSLLLCYSSQGQLLPNKIDVIAGMHNSSGIGSAFINHKGFVMPSALRNLNSMNGLQMKVLYKKWPSLSVGLAADYHFWNNWQHPTHTDYNGLLIQNVFLSPGARYTKSPQFSGSLINKLNFFAELAPGAGYSILKTGNPIYLIYEGNQRLQTSAGTSDLFAGINSALGFNFFITSGYGFYASYSLGYYYMNSSYYADRSFFTTRIDAGVFFRLYQDKRQFYTLPQ